MTGPGLDICTQVTGRSAAPVVILASWDSDGVEQRLNHGADHYVVWPQRRREMVARLRAVVRRASGYRVEAFRVQPFQVDLGSRIVAVRGLGYRYERPRRCHNSSIVDSIDTES